MSETSGAAKAAPAAVAPAGPLSAAVAWIRNLDIRRVAQAIGWLMLIEQGIVSGAIDLNGGFPAAWIPHIVWWCKFSIAVESVLLVGHTTTAVRWPKPGMPAIGAAAAILLAIGLALAPAPARAAPRAAPLTGNIAADFANAKKAIQGGAASALGGVSPATVAQNFEKLSVADLTFAEAQANGAGTAPAKARAACYSAVLTTAQAVAAISVTPPAPKGSDGQALAKPDPAVISNVEIGLETAEAAEQKSQLILNALQPNSTMMLACAEGAAATGQNTMAFVNQIVTGALAIKAAIPLIP